MATTMEELKRKAKAYDEAVENMRKFRNALNNHEETDLWVSKKDIVTDIEYYFPELKESEDEKVRKELIIHCRNTRCVTEEGAERIAKWIAWLKKQGERKPAWSEDDEHRAKDTIYFLDTAKKHYASTVELDACIDWLKSLKQRIGG